MTKTSIFSNCWFLLGILTIGFAPFVFAQSELANKSSSLSHAADSLLQRVVDLEEHVGISAGLYVEGNHMWSHGVGLQDRKNKIPASAEMIHRIASISKSMTAVAVLQLVEQGKVDLDAPIQTYVPEFPPKAEGEITVRQILTHTSGIRHYKGMLDMISFKQYPNLLSAMKKFQKRDLVGKPGEVYHYTTYGYVVLGVLIEQLSGLSYSDYMTQYIWKPSGMQHTSVETKESFSDPNKSGLYRITDKGTFKKDPRTNLSVKIPGGGIQSTAADLLLFGKAIIEHRLLKPESMKQMLVDPGIREGGNPYGMGWFLYQNDENGLIIGHSGSQAGTCSQLLIVPEKGVVASVISNTRNQWPEVIGLCSQLMKLGIASIEEADPASSDK
ncbi:MAG: serine hydrolase domain-containing protein [Bacteroidota bacterium]